MPWRTCRPMDERLRFIARLLEGEKMAPLCREFENMLRIGRDDGPRKTEKHERTPRLPQD